MTKSERKEATGTLTGALDAEQEVFFEAVEKLAKEFGISSLQATKVNYLRTRSRWTPELEKELIERLKEGEDINILDFGVTEESLAAATKLVDEVAAKYEK
ncbi:MAG: hypothetical protein M0P09_00330 [Acholeplasmataceae bacterium]|nr:hypothetical protein [Acholeplasmataceae bacterium]